MGVRGGREGRGDREVALAGRERVRDLGGRLEGREMFGEIISKVESVGRGGVYMERVGGKRGGMGLLEFTTLKLGVLGGLGLSSSSLALE